MTQQISSEEDEKINHNQMLMRCYGDRMEANRKLLAIAESSMEEVDIAKFVQVSHTFLSGTRSSTPIFTSEFFVCLAFLYSQLNTFLRTYHVKPQ